MESILAVIFVFSTVVLLHELGHFWVCRWQGIRVQRFSIGFGKEIFGFQYGDTRWSICLLPLGGYIEPAGADYASFTGQSDEFLGKHWFRRILVAVAGPAMNYILSFFCFTLIFFVFGKQTVGSDLVVGGFVDGYPAQYSGIKKGDQVVSINDVPVQDWSQMQKLVNLVEVGYPVDVEIARKIEDETVFKKFLIIPKQHTSKDTLLIGMTPHMITEELGFFQSIQDAFDRVIKLTVLNIVYLYNSIIHRKKPEISGPIGIITIISKTAEAGWGQLLNLIGLLSLSLGLFNLFPIPLLDGGHVVLYFIEGLIGKPLNEKFVKSFNILGMILLFSILIFATFQDIIRFKFLFNK